MQPLYKYIPIRKRNSDVSKIQKKFRFCIMKTSELTK